MPLPDQSAADAPTVIRSEGSSTHRNLNHTPGQRIGPFELISPLGVGGMATVWKAIDRELGREVSLKILPPELAGDGDHITRFKLEAQSAAALDHPGIAKAFQCGEWDGIHAIAFEYVPGETLKHRLENSGTLSPKEAVAYLRDLAAGLAHAASRGVVHRDVKPANIVVTPEGRAKLIDMGLARRQDGAVTNGAVTTSGVTLGTFDYLSPEQALDPRRVDVRSDLYSLGCTFYHLLTGRPPVPEGTAARKLHSHQHEKPADPRTLNPVIPDDLAVVLSRLMMKRPADRYQSPDELERDLAVLSEQLATPAGVAAPRLMSSPAPLHLGWIAAVGAIAAAVFIVFGATNSGPKEGKRTVSNVKQSVVTPEIVGPVANTPVTTADGFLIVRSAEELATALREGRELIRLDPGREYDLSNLPAIVFKGSKLILETAVNQTLATIILPATFADPVVDTTFTIRGSASVELRRIVVRTVPSAVEQGPVIDPCGLFFDRVGRVECVECRFEMHELLKTGKAAAVYVQSEEQTQLSMRSCLFPSGSVALRQSGDVNTIISETAFGPHESVFDLNPGKGTFTLSHCTFLMRANGGAIVEIEEGTQNQLQMGHCLFAAAGPASTPVMMMGHRDVPVLVRADTAKAAVKWTAIPNEPNAYYRVDALAVGDVITPFDKRSEVGIDDPNAVSTIRPWAESDPIGSVSDLVDPWRAFRAKLDLTSLRVPRDVIVGVRHRSSDGLLRIYPGDWPPPRPADLMAGPVKIWWPGAPANEVLPRNASRQLDELLAIAKTGDVIEIRHTGTLPIRPIRLNSTGMNLTFRAAEGRRPVLVPDPSFRGSESYLFDVSEGEISFDGVDFNFSARRNAAESKGSAIVRLAGGAGCTFRRCVITLDETDERIAMAILANSEVDAMKMPGISPQRMKCEDCLIRGSGRVVWAQTGKPFLFDASNSVMAMEGSVVTLEPPTREMNSITKAKIRFSRLTAALAGPLIEMKASKKTDGTPLLLPLDVSSSRCLFAAVGSSRPLMIIDGGDPSESPDSYFTWDSDQPSKYVNWDRSASLLEIRPSDSTAGMTAQTFDADEWLRRITKEPGRSVGRLRFNHFPTSAKALAEVTAADLNLTPRRSDTLTPMEPLGADTQTVPKPVE